MCLLSMFLDLVEGLYPECPFLMLAFRGTICSYIDIFVPLGLLGDAIDVCVQSSLHWESIIALKFKYVVMHHDTVVSCHL